LDDRFSLDGGGADAGFPNVNWNGFADESVAAFALRLEPNEIGRCFASKGFEEPNEKATCSKTS
jgi:hypothetical protein